MKATRDYFPNASISEETADEYLMDWASLIKKYGLQRFEDGLVIARRHEVNSDGVAVPRRFFPLPSEIEERICNGTDSPLIAVTDLNCPECKGTGWKYTQSAKQHRETTRCHCRKLVKRA